MSGDGCSMTMGGFVSMAFAFGLCGCAAKDAAVEQSPFQNAVYVVGDNMPAKARPAVDIREAQSDESKSALKRIYWFFAGR
jgi:hypothetical protein